MTKDPWRQVRQAQALRRLVERHRSEQRRRPPPPKRQPQEQSQAEEPEDS